MIKRRKIYCLTVVDNSHKTEYTRRLHDPTLSNNSVDAHVKECRQRSKWKIFEQSDNRSYPVDFGSDLQGTMAGSRTEKFETNREYLGSFIEHCLAGPTEVLF